MDSQFVPDLFMAPVSYESKPFYFRPLNHEVAEQDYEAVMSSQKSLQGIFGPDYNWPESTMTLLQSKASLQVHQQEFIANQAFAYSVLNNAKDKCLGSVYIDPCKLSTYDCEVYFWIRDDSQDLEELLYQTVLTWLKHDWPFSKLAFPGRNITWHDWQAVMNVNKQ